MEELVSLKFREVSKMSGMTCDVNGCKWNDGNGNCECEGIYISDCETGEPMCMSAEFEDESEI